MFLTGSVDGQLRMWDLRNEAEPLFTLKRNKKLSDDDYKLFAVCWNGGSQILSGGSDSHTSVHEMN